MTIILPASQKPRVHKKLLMIECLGDGPWVPVFSVTDIVIHGATSNDVIDVFRRGEGGFYHTEPVRLYGAGRHPVIIPRGEIKAVRVAGNSPLTVFAESRP